MGGGLDVAPVAAERPADASPASVAAAVAAVFSLLTTPGPPSDEALACALLMAVAALVAFLDPDDGAALARVLRTFLD